MTGEIRDQPSFAKASEGILLRIEIGGQVLRRASREAGWRAVLDEEGHYVYAMAL
jgi:hypothetical protein